MKTLLLILISLIFLSYGNEGKQKYYVHRHLEATIVPVNYKVQPSHHTDWYYDIDSRMTYSAGHDWVLVERLYLIPVDDPEKVIVKSEKVIKR